MDVHPIRIDNNRFWPTPICLVGKSSTGHVPFKDDHWQIGKPCHPWAKVQDWRRPYLPDCSLLLLIGVFAGLLIFPQPMAISNHGLGYHMNSSGLVFWVSQTLSTPFVDQFFHLFSATKDLLPVVAVGTGPQRIPPRILFISSINGWTI